MMVQRWFNMVHYGSSSVESKSSSSCYMLVGNWDNVILWLQNCTNTFVHMVTLHQKDTFSLSIAFERTWRSICTFEEKLPEI